MIKAASFCETAASLISSDRNKQHGDSEINHNNIARLWEAYLYGKNEPINAHDVMLMMVLLKIARTKTGTLNFDDYIDGIGYLALAAQLKSDWHEVVPTKEGELT